MCYEGKFQAFNVDIIGTPLANFFSRSYKISLFSLSRDRLLVGVRSLETWRLLNNNCWNLKTLLIKKSMHASSISEPRCCCWNSSNSESFFLHTFYSSQSIVCLFICTHSKKANWIANNLSIFHPHFHKKRLFPQFYAHCLCKNW